VILLDTSIWIEYLRGTQTAATAFVRDHIGIDAATTEPVLMELLAGARPGGQTTRIERLLLSQHWCTIEPALDYHAAASIYQTTRAAGHQPRSLQDCLLAAIAMRRNVPIAHRDKDFARIADATGLTTIDLRDGPDPR